MEKEEAKQLFESGAMLIRDYKGHEQMLMNEGTFIEIIKSLSSQGQKEIEELKENNNKQLKIIGNLGRYKTIAEELDKKIQELESTPSNKGECDAIEFAEWFKNSGYKKATSELYTLFKQSKTK